MRTVSSGGGGKAPKKKKPAPKKAAPKKAAYSAKMKKYATNEANAARYGKKPSSLAAKKPAKPKTVREGQKLTAAEKKAYKAGTAKLKSQAQAALKPKASRTTSKRAQANSDWEKGLSVRNWAQGQPATKKIKKSIWDKITFWD